ncbi:MAG: copper-binding protein [Pseudomonadota bacterium]
MVRFPLRWLVPATLLAAATAAPAESLTHAEVRQIDTVRNQITLKHARIKSINMAAMTMPFRVKDATLLKAVKVGDKIRFAVEEVDGHLVVTQILPAK